MTDDYRVQVRATLRRMTDQALSFQDARIPDNNCIDRQEIDREISRRLSIPISVENRNLSLAWYWTMPAAELAASYTAATDGVDFNDDPTGEKSETVAFIEDAIMQRIGAPDDADPATDPVWLKRLEEFVAANSVIA